MIPKEAKDQSTFFSNLWKKVSDADKEVGQRMVFALETLQLLTEPLSVRLGIKRPLKKS